MMRWQATSEQLLMTFYNAGLPAMSMPTSNSVDLQDTSVALLRDNCPWILAKYVPWDVGIDGNCLFRSVSLALYGTESFYMPLRVLCLIDVLQNSALYDIESSSFYSPSAADVLLCLPNYDAFVHNVARDGGYSSMLTVLAVSSVVQKPIQTVWLLTSTPGAPSSCTKLVMGSGVQSANHPIYVLWTTCSYEGRTANGVNINHFVPLIERCPETETHVMNIDGPSQTHSTPTRAPTPVPNDYDHKCL